MTPQTHSAIEQQVVEIQAEHRRLPSILRLPRGSRGIVLFAHGSGSGRHSPRNQFVAQALNEVGLATLLLDLLDEDEADNRKKVFDIELLASRLQTAADWLADQPQTQGLQAGFFGASTGAAAALAAAARQPDQVGAVVSRGGRPDLAYDLLPAVTAPTLLIVGGADETVLELNEQAFRRLRCPKELVIVPGATHLFPEPGALEEVARLASEWFREHLTGTSRDHEA